MMWIVIINILIGMAAVAVAAQLIRWLFRVNVIVMELKEIKHTLGILNAGGAREYLEAVMRMEGKTADDLEKDKAIERLKDEQTGPTNGQKTGSDENKSPK